MKELAKAYNPKETEDKIYDLWLKSSAFQPKIDSDKKPFVIVIPPPNVTGSLHMGHALNNTIQDILIRRSRMRGIPTLWLPGTDHAGIATQNVIEKQLGKVGKNRNDLGREEFIKQVWTWVDEYGDIIIKQLKKMGCSCDWTRQRFTMDKNYQEAVNTAFKHYYDKGLIYQGERVINWCVRCQTSLSDIEVEHKEISGKLYYFKYDKDFPITIATTRPETKLGDTAVAVNPEDKRYQQYIDRTFSVNFCGVKREIKIIADKSIDPQFGTGAVGVTPAHSLIDAELAEKHHLKSLTVIDKYGRITNGYSSNEVRSSRDARTVIPDELVGLKVAEAREKIIDILSRDNLIEKTEDITHNLSVCYRCGKEIEPQPSKQWFLKMSELIKPAIQAIEKGEIKITPDRWKKVYLDFMKNIRDWCISRQIWWGHQLPVWVPKVISNSKFQISNEIQNSMKNENCKLKIYVGDNPPADFKQVDDVLDTWFSSALWPFATLGWPKCHPESSDEGSLGLSENRHSSEILHSVQNDKSNDLHRFYPTTVLSTARDINMLWVVRMIFSGFEFMKEKPFSSVYIHPTVFNKEGKRMSKSLGTGVDPLALIDKYGADAVRFGLTYINTGTQDIKFDENAILAGRKFANKVWNISRFVLMQIGNNPTVITSRQQAEKQSIKITASPSCLKANNIFFERSRKNGEVEKLVQTPADKKILKSLNQLIASVNNDLDNFRFGQAAHNLYDFVWHDFADVYIEASKNQMDDNTRAILLFVLRTSLALLHPFMPFVTEEVWLNLYNQKLVSEKMLISSRWPKN